MEVPAMKITRVQAHPISFRVPEGQNVRLGIGRAVKRDAVLVKVNTDEGLVGWGEAHHGRAPGAIAKLVDTTLRELVTGMDALDTVGVWDRVYRMQLASHGMGAAAAMALSGLDLALWDIRGKAANLPLYRLAGGASRAIPAYAGGISLGWQDPAALAEEALRHVASGYRALKLRVGDSPARDIARLAAVRAALDEDIAVLVDANTGYTLADVRRVMPAYEAHGVGWLEEPFPAHDHRAYQQAATLARVGLAAGENHFTRFEFTRLIEDGAVSFVQPDLSKTGGMSETLRIAALASAWKITCNPHTSATCINMAASIHALCAIDNPGYFEGDVTTYNPFRDRMGSAPYTLDAQGCVRPLQVPGIGVEVDETFIAAHPLIDGPGFV
jgi:L-alanine-DL-glutamate epimerase-like enolase superfamily enzyme